MPPMPPEQNVLQLNVPSIEPSSHQRSIHRTFSPSIEPSSPERSSIEPSAPQRTASFGCPCLEGLRRGGSPHDALPRPPLTTPLGCQPPSRTPEPELGWMVGSNREGRGGEVGVAPVPSSRLVEVLHPQPPRRCSGTVWVSLRAASGSPSGRCLPTDHPPGGHPWDSHPARGVSASPGSAPIVCPELSGWASAPGGLSPFLPHQP